MSIISTSHPMGYMLADPDPVITEENEDMNIVAMAFQEIACDSHFQSKIGDAIDDDLEFDVRLFLDNNPSYKSIIDSWLTANNYSYSSVMRIGNNEGPWAFACNYGNHNSSLPAILAISADLDSLVLGENDDFIPCYFSNSDCGSYQIGLIGLQGDLSPENQSLPTKALTIVFEVGANDLYAKTTELGTEIDNSGTLVYSDGADPNICEKPETVNLLDFRVIQRFNRGKKVKVRSNWRYSKNTVLPCDFYSGVFHTRKQYLIKDDALNVLGTFSPNLRADRTFYISSSTIGMTGVVDRAVVGVVYEHDWYAKKKKNRMEITWCNKEIKIRTRNRKHGEIYAAYYFYADWCLNDTYRFTAPAGIGDQNSWIEIKSEFQTYLD